MTVLVVDDDSAMRRLLQAILHRGGYSVLVAASGEDGLNLLRARVPIAVILLDLVMPHMDGRSFRRAQLSDPSMAAIPTLLLTGAEISPAVRDELHVDGIIRKPFKVDTLLATIRAHALAHTN